MMQYYFQVHALQTRGSKQNILSDQGITPDVSWFLSRLMLSTVHIHIAKCKTHWRQHHISRVHKILWTPYNV